MNIVMVHNEFLVFNLPPFVRYYSTHTITKTVLKWFPLKKNINLMSYTDESLTLIDNVIAVMFFVQNIDFLLIINIGYCNSMTW